MNSTNKHHNDGQKGASQNTYRPPHERGIVGDLLGYTKKEIADRKAYSKGWQEGRRHRRR